MGDFLLDFRDPATRRQSADRAASLLRWCDDTQVKTITQDVFSLVLTRVDGFDLWGPCEYQAPPGNILVALAGRVALDEPEWNAAGKFNAPGGLACRAIMARYLRAGVDSFSALNGNFVAFVADQRTHQFHVVTDRCGMFLAYGREPLDRSVVLCSHPDVLASLLGESQNLDETSLSEFLITGRLTFPHTYYGRLKALEPGSVVTFDLGQGNPLPGSPRRFFSFDFQIGSASSAPELAQELAAAFRKAVCRRSLPLFGQTGVGLSGGLDSRAILSAARNGVAIRAFNLYDQPNAETRAARALADAAGVELTPIQRDFEYYANSAELGVRISGGSGNIASNHFLGARKRLSSLGIRNLLTGCYCDYLLKGLSLNTAERTFSRQERLTTFTFQHYHRHYWGRTRHSAPVRARLEALFPEATKPTLTEEDWLQIERKRAFPLAYEGDLAQRVIPQRVIPWFIPIVDNDLLDVYLRIPSRYKLNGSLFKKMVRLVCDDDLSGIPDSNTGAALDAAGPRYAFHRFLSALSNRLNQKLSPRMATRGSWPNWEYYLQHSRVIPKLWARKSPVASDWFVQLLGADPTQDAPGSCNANGAEYFMRLFTLKLWLDQRAGLQPLVSDHLPPATCH